MHDPNAPHVFLTKSAAPPVTAPIEKVDGWLPIESAPKDYGVRMLLTVGFPNQYRTVIGERNNDGNTDYWWIHGEMGSQRATETYMGLPVAWKPLDAPSARLQLQRQGD